MECFYGPLWSPGARREVVRAAARHGATSYVYGPAADLRTGERWREPYTGADGMHLEGVADDVRAAGLELVWRVSPGAPLARSAAMALADGAELDTLVRRLREAVALGADRVLVAFDDIDAAVDGGTRLAFRHDVHPLAAAHASVLNGCARALGELGVPMLACPTHYWGVSPSRYRSRLGELLDPDVVVCWTGPAVVATRVLAAQAEMAREQFGHDLYLWDNYPVNDWDVESAGFSNDIEPRRLPLAPLEGREPRVADVVVGYGANLALQALAGVPALCTALDWARSPDAYDPAVSFARALVETGEDADALAVLADAVARPAPGGAPTPGRLAAGAAAVLADGGGAASVEALRGELDRTAAATAALLASSSNLAKEMGPWIRALRVAVAAAGDALDVVDAYAGDPERLADAVARVRAAVRPDRHVAGGLLDVLVDHARSLGGPAAPPSADEFIDSGLVR
jgi:hyaluronoglucosaminidase